MGSLKLLHSSHGRPYHFRASQYSTVGYQSVCMVTRVAGSRGPPCDAEPCTAPGHRRPRTPQRRHYPPPEAPPAPPPDGLTEQQPYVRLTNHLPDTSPAPRPALYTAAALPRPRPKPGPRPQPEPDPDPDPEPVGTDRRRMRVGLCFVTECAAHCVPSLSLLASVRVTACRHPPEPGACLSCRAERAAHPSRHGNARPTVPFCVRQTHPSQFSRFIFDCFQPFYSECIFERY